MIKSFDEFANYLLEQDRSKLTIKGYVADMQHFEKWFERTSGENLSLEKLTSERIRQYRQELLDAAAKPQTINRKLAALAAYGHWAATSGRVASNPTLNIRCVDNVPLAPKWLDKRQRAALMRAVDHDLRIARQRFPRLWVLRLRDAAVVLLLLNTGLRVGELCALDVGDIHISDRKGSVTVRVGKGQKRRSIPLNSPSRKILREWLEVRPEEAGNALFIGQRNERIQTRSIQRAVTRYAIEAGLENVTPHILRHSFSKALVDAGVTLEKVAALLGHSNLNTTRIYTTPGEKDLEDAVGMLDG